MSDSEELEHPSPRVFGRTVVETRAAVAEEAMPDVRVGDDLVSNT